MKIKFISIVKKGNSAGTGVIYIPKEKYNFINLGERVKVILSENIFFYSKIIKDHKQKALYIPKNITTFFCLLRKRINCQLEKLKEGFYAPIALDGRVYIPYDVANNINLHKNDIIFVKAMEDNRIVKEKYVKVSKTERINRKASEYIFYVDKKLGGKTLVFKIKKLPRIIKNNKIGFSKRRLLREFSWASVGNNHSAVIFRGNKLPAIINTRIIPSHIAFYLGAYFSDGTKIGNSWAICASTFEQARYYLKMHNLLVKDSRPEFTISYTNIYKTDHSKLKKSLGEKWKNKVGINVHKFRIIEPKGKLISEKWHRYGTLVIREHKQILLDFYNALLRSLINEILSKKDKSLSINFIRGIMEGDGSPSAPERGGIMISANKNDVQIITKILKVAQINFKLVKEENKYALRIGALEILRNFYSFKNRIFILYPKRRRKFFKRLKTVGAVKFLIGNHKPTNWVTAWLRNNGFVTENYKITKKGLIIGNILLDEMRQVGV